MEVGLGLRVVLEKGGGRTEATELLRDVRVDLMKTHDQNDSFHTPTHTPTHCQTEPLMFHTHSLLSLSSSPRSHPSFFCSFLPSSLFFPNGHIVVIGRIEDAKCLAQKTFGIPMRVRQASWASTSF